MSDTDADAPVATPGATAARVTLHAKLRSCYARTAAAGAALAKAVQRANTQTDLVAHFADTAATILALEDVKTAAEAAGKDLRTALMTAFLDSGCPSVSTDDFTVYLSREPPFLEVIDAGRVPPDLWTKPVAEPDRKKIKQALDAGRSVPGASMNVRNSSRLVIRGKSQ